MTLAPVSGAEQLAALRRAVSKFAIGATALLEQIGEAARALTDWLLGRRRPSDPRIRLGAWNFVADGRWQSDLCAAWVHTDCALPSRCDCTCHGGTLR